MKLNTKTLALKTADRVAEKLEEQLTEALQEAVTEILEENGIELDDDDAWETMMEVAGRVVVTAV